MGELFVEKVINTVEDFLDNNQRIKLKEILTEICLNYQIERIQQTKKQQILKNNTDILNKFISSKEIEGCSTRTLNYYKENIIKMLDTINLPIGEITTELLRKYLADYKSNSKAGMVTMDNIMRTLSSFFTWLENEDYIIKNPVRRIHKVKTTRKVKDNFLRNLYLMVQKEEIPNVLDNLLIESNLSLEIYNFYLEGRIMNTYICYECKFIMTPTLDNKKMICNNCKLSTELFLEEKEKMSKHNVILF